MRFPHQLLLLMFLSLSMAGTVSGCGDDEGGDPAPAVTASNRADLVTLIEFSARSHELIFDTLSLLSNGYTVKFFEGVDPTPAELDAYYVQLQLLAEEADAADAALTRVQGHSGGLGASPQWDLGTAFERLGSIFRGPNARARDRIIANWPALPADRQQEAFNEIRSFVVDNYGLSGPDDFFAKLQAQELDEYVNLIENDLLNHPDYGAQTVASGENHGTIFARDAMEVAVGTVETVALQAVGNASTLISGANYVQKATDMAEKAQMLYTDPLGTMGDEIKAAAEAKLNGYLDIDGAVDAVGLSEDAGEAIKFVSDVAIGSDQPLQVAANALGRAVVNIVDDASGDTADIVLAEKTDSAFAGEPEAIIAAPDPNNMQVILTPGSWQITLSNSAGGSDTFDLDVADGDVVDVSGNTGGTTTEPPPTGGGCEGWCTCLKDAAGVSDTDPGYLECIDVCSSAAPQPSQGEYDACVEGTSDVAPECVGTCDFVKP